jgi:hypothetical protein
MYIYGIGYVIAICIMAYAGFWWSSGNQPSVPFGEKEYVPPSVGNKE